MERNFSEWFSTFRSSINTYKSYTDFPKVYTNINAIKIELNILNSLIGSKDIENDFVKIITQYPNTLQCIPILLAVRCNEIFAMDETGEFHYNFVKMNYSIEEYRTFMRKTGLFDLLANHLISNLIDYATGVEVGLGSNGRKQRCGRIMEDLVESYIEKAGFVKNQTYFKEMYIKNIDYVIKTDSTIYGIETNFYNANGSKLNETARSYKTLALEAQDIPNFKFVWITDGGGWLGARHNLEETFDVMDDIYNIKDLESGVLERLK